VVDSKKRAHQPCQASTGRSDLDFWCKEKWCAASSRVSTPPAAPGGLKPPRRIQQPALNFHKRKRIKGECAQQEGRGSRARGHELDALRVQRAASRRARSRPPCRSQYTVLKSMGWAVEAHRSKTVRGRSSGQHFMVEHVRLGKREEGRKRDARHCRCGEGGRKGAARAGQRCQPPGPDTDRPPASPARPLESSRRGRGSAAGGIKGARVDCKSRLAVKRRIIPSTCHFRELWGCVV
jgi:hypothetical protein